MISKLLAAYPADTTDTKTLLDWCRKVQGQYSGDIGTTIKSLLEKQEEAADIAEEIKATRDALKGICTRSKHLPNALAKLPNIKSKIDAERERQSATIPITHDAEVTSCLKRYSESLACALALLEQPAPAQKGRRRRRRKPAPTTATSDTQPLPKLDEDEVLAILNDGPAVTPSEVTTGETVPEESEPRASDSSTAAAKNVRARVGGDKEKGEVLQELSKEKLAKSIAAAKAAKAKGVKPKKKSWLPWRNK